MIVLVKLYHVLEKIVLLLRQGRHDEAEIVAREAQSEIKEEIDKMEEYAND